MNAGMGVIAFAICTEHYCLYHVVPLAEIEKSSLFLSSVLILLVSLYLFGR